MYYYHLIDVVGKPLVEILHVPFLLIPRVFDCVDAGRRHHGVLALVEREVTAAARARLDRPSGRLAGAAL